MAMHMLREEVAELANVIADLASSVETIAEAQSEPVASTSAASVLETLDARDEGLLAAVNASMQDQFRAMLSTLTSVMDTRLQQTAQGLQLPPMMAQLPPTPLTYRVPMAVANETLQRSSASAPPPSSLPAPSASVVVPAPEVEVLVDSPAKPTEQEEDEDELAGDDDEPVAEAPCAKSVGNEDEDVDMGDDIGDNGPVVGEDVNSRVDEQSGVSDAAPEIRTNAAGDDDSSPPPASADADRPALQLPTPSASTGVSEQPVDPSATSDTATSPATTSSDSLEEGGAGNSEEPGPSEGRQLRSKRKAGDPPPTESPKKKKSKAGGSGKKPKPAKPT